MAYHIKFRDKAITLRKKGYSLSEIQNRLHIPKNTLSGWLRSTPLSFKAKSRLLEKINKGQLVAAENKRRKVNSVLSEYLLSGEKLADELELTSDLSLVLCSLIYWCEGVKDVYSGVRFSNSDPQLMRTFLALMRTALEIDEAKFRACIHLHSYHNAEKQLKFWSKVTNIPASQFIKPFNKANTGKRIRKGYNGCVSLRYHDVRIARRLLMTAKAFLNKHGGVVKLAS